MSSFYFWFVTYKIIINTLYSLNLISFFSDVSLNVEAGVDIVHQEEIKFFKIGENLTLTCMFTSFATAVTWLKQSAKGETVFIASINGYLPIKLQTDLENTGRFSAIKKDKTFTLKISKTELSDSATYICAALYYGQITFNRIPVSVLRGENKKNIYY